MVNGSDTYTATNTAIQNALVGSFVQARAVSMMPVSTSNRLNRPTFSCSP